MKEKDIVSDVLARAAEAAREWVTGNGFEQTMADEIARHIMAKDAQARKHWARCEPYVAARSPDKEEAKQKALEEAKRSGKVAEAGSRFGVSRATLYRLLKGR